MRDCLIVAVGLMGSKDPADSTFQESKGEETTKSPPVWPSELGLKGVLNLREPHSEHAFAGHSGSSTTCKHSQELTPGLLELKVTGVFTASVPFTAV